MLAMRGQDDRTRVSFANTPEV